MPSRPRATPKRRPPGRGRAASGALLMALPCLALLLAAGLCLTAPILPLQNFNESIYQGALFKDILSGHPGGFALRPWPTPEVFVQFLLGLSMFVLPPLLAGRLLVTAYILAFAVLSWRLCRRPDGGTDHAVFALMVPVAILNADFWDGDLNFQIGLMLLALHLLLTRTAEWRWWQEALFAVLMFFVHPLTLAMLALHIGWSAAQRHGLVRGTLRVIAAVLPALVLLAWHSRAVPDDGGAQPGRGLAAALAHKATVLAGYGPYQNMAFGGQGDWQRQPWLYGIGVALNAAFAAATFLPVLPGLLGSLRARRGVPEAMTALTGILAFLVLPGAAFGARFLAPATVFALSAAEDWRRLRRIAAALACTAPLMVLYIGLRQSQPAPGHRAATDPADSTAWLFRHDPLAFRDAALAAQAGTHTHRLGLPGGIVMAR